MSHWSTTLESGWVTRSFIGTDVVKLQWQSPANKRPQITGGLLADPDNDERFLSRLSFSTSEIIIHITATRSGGIIGGQQDLSDAWETNHRIRMTLGEHQFTLPDDPSIADDLTEHYRYTPGTGAGAFQNDLSAFLLAVGTDALTTDLELILWDGQGDNPFIDPATEVPVGWFANTVVTKHWAGPTEIEKQWSGQNLI